MVDVDIRVSTHLKEELTWAIDKRFYVISTIMLFKSTKELKETKEYSHFKFKTILYALLCGPYLRILSNLCKDKYPIFKQEAAKKAG